MQNSHPWFLCQEAYTYSYVAFGELIAWTIGWALIMEYAIGNITVAISWSDYFTGLLTNMGVHVPAWMTMDYLTAMKGFKQAEALLAGESYSTILTCFTRCIYGLEGITTIIRVHIVADLPALLIIILITMSCLSWHSGIEKCQ